MKEETASRRGSVDAIGQTFKMNIVLRNFSDQVDEAFDAAPETIELPDHEYIATTQGVQSLSKTRPLRMRRAQVVFVNLLAAGMLESLELKSEVLILRGNAGISDQHTFLIVLESRYGVNESRRPIESGF